MARTLSLTAAADRAVHQGVEGRHLPAPTDQARPGAPDQAILRADRQQSAGGHRFVGPLDMQPLRVREHGGVFHQSCG